MFSVVLGAVLISCSFLHLAHAQTEKLGQGYEFEGNGKQQLDCFKSTYQLTHLPPGTLDLTRKRVGLHKAYARQKQALYARGKQTFSLSGQSFEHFQLYKVAQKVKNLPLTVDTVTLEKQFKPYLIKGEDGCGNTHFTAYFAPLIQVRSQPDSEYKFPIYKSPTSWPGGNPLTRSQIDGDKKLAGQHLELAYAKSLLEIFFLQVQGSGLAQEVDTGKKYTLQYNSQNGFPYSSVGRYLVEHNHIPADKISLDAIRAFFQSNPDKLEPFLFRNESYTFFKKVNTGPKGSLGTEVVPSVSIAVDPQYIPLGATLLAETPKLDAAGQFMGHELTLLVAQDTGGAIKGTGHVDLYMGVGLAAQNAASRMHHYGRLWLLLPK